MRALSSEAARRHQAAEVTWSAEVRAVRGRVVRSCEAEVSLE